jgi:hypothetical protein
VTQSSPERVKTKRMLLLVVISLCLLSCRLINSTTQPEASQTQLPGEIVFQDDFSDPESGWVRASTPKGEADYSDGAYRILVNTTDLDIWSHPGQTINDLRIEVDAFKVGGDRNNRFGLICRMADTESFYTFIISSDGYYGIGKVKGSQYTLIGMDALQPSEAIELGSALNHIQAECIGNSLSLTVNGELLAQVQDSEFSAGDVGLIAGTYSIPGTDIRFDNFIVTQP